MLAIHPVKPSSGVKVKATPPAGGVGIAKGACPDLVAPGEFVGRMVVVAVNVGVALAVSRIADEEMVRLVASLKKEREASRRHAQAINAPSVVAKKTRVKEMFLDFVIMHHPVDR